MADLTTANAEFALEVDGVFTTPQAMQGWAADDAFATDNIAPNEVLMGVDGLLSGGYVAYPTKLMFTLQADSPSVVTMDTLISSMDAVRGTFPISANIAIPNLGKQYTFTRGFLTGARKFGDAKKLSQPLKYELTFQSCQPAPI